MKDNEIYLNITRLECKLSPQRILCHVLQDLNITRLECKCSVAREKAVGTEGFEYHQIGM